MYGSKEVFLRELLSNANDALEKLRLTALRDKDIVANGEFNVTIAAERDSTESTVGKLIITDTGIGMTPEELKMCVALFPSPSRRPVRSSDPPKPHRLPSRSNLGTIAKSGTSDFQAKGEASLASDNLVGQFGLGAYSAFLIASTVEFASLPPISPSNPKPKQHVFRSSADGSTFEIFEDPRGNTLGERGTEITLHLREGEGEWLDEKRLRELVYVLDDPSCLCATFPLILTS